MKPTATFNPNIDRHDRHAAARIFAHLWPDPRIARSVARLIADTVTHAHAIAAASWEVTLFPDAVRVNVGPTEALVLHERGAHLIVAAPLGSADHPNVELRMRRNPVFPSVPIPSGTCFVPSGEIRLMPSAVRDALFRYIEAAARRRRTSTWQKHFSPAVLRHVESILGTPLPRPTYYSGGEVDVLSLPDEVGNNPDLYEGAKYSVTVNAYERDPDARRRCIAHHGHDCFVCGFSFASTYGDSFSGYIHVHHVRPLAKIGRSYKVDPVTDLVPVCPNCHAAMHRTDPPITPADLKAMLNRKDYQ